MAKFIKVKSNAYREILVNKEHILFFRPTQDGAVIIKLDAPYNGDTVSIYTEEDYESFKDRVLNNNIIIRLWQHLLNRLAMRSFLIIQRRSRR